MTPKLQRIAANEAAGAVARGNGWQRSDIVPSGHSSPMSWWENNGDKDLEFSPRKSKVVPIPSA